MLAADALRTWPGAVTLLTIADGRDDIGTTVSAFCPVSMDPPLVLASLIAESYPAEVLGRLSTFAVTLLAGGGGRGGGGGGGAGPRGGRRPRVGGPPGSRRLAGRARGCCWTACRTSAGSDRARSSRPAAWPRSSAR
jgi:hypothetical protein